MTVSFNLYDFFKYIVQSFINCRGLFFNGFIVLTTLYLTINQVVIINSYPIEKEIVEFVATKRFETHNIKLNIKDISCNIEDTDYPKCQTAKYQDKIKSTFLEAAQLLIDISKNTAFLSLVLSCIAFILFPLIKFNESDVNTEKNLKKEQPLSENEENITDKVDELKSIEFHSAAVNAWFNTRLELDKNLLTLSSGGVALLMGLMSTTGIHTIEKLSLYIVAIISFVVCIGSSLFIFRLNSIRIEEIINNEKSSIGNTLKNLDLLNYLSFFVGVILSIMIGISSATDSFSAHHQEKLTPQMNQQATPNQINR